MVATKDSKTNVWREIRSAYIERPQKPTYAELAEEFRVPANTLGVYAADEGWVLLRSQHLESVALACNAQEGMIELAKGNREVAATFINFALVGVKRLTRVIESIEEGTKPRAESDIIQNCAFAASNFAKSLKEIGVIVIPRSLADGLEAKGDAGKDFLKGALQQINITVQAAQNGTAPAVVSETIQEKTADEAPPP